MPDPTKSFYASCSDFTEQYEFRDKLI